MDEYNLNRFLDAQNLVYGDVLEELSQAQKVTHWMWFIFPQIDGLGRSYVAKKFAISSCDEALAYIAHPILGARLKECTQLVINAQGRDASQIFGFPDDLKFRSSMTLFAWAAKDNSVFKNALIKYFSGQPDHATLELINVL